MGFFSNKAEGTYHATTLDIRDMRCNVNIQRKGNGKRVAVKIIQGTHPEKTTLRASQQGALLKLTAGLLGTPRRIVHMASGSSGVQVVQDFRNTTIRGGGMAIGNAGNIHFNTQSGDAHVGSARGVNFGTGLTVSLVVGAAVQIIE